MKSCVGLPSFTPSTLRTPDAANNDDEEEHSFPCEPSTVVYGHAATRGLDIKRYSMGLDTGCLYGRELTALVVNRGSGSHSHEEEDIDEDDENTRKRKRRLGRRQRKGKGKHRVGKVEFGDAGMGLDARLVQVKCTLPPQSDSHDH